MNNTKKDINAVIYHLKNGLEIDPAWSDEQAREYIMLMQFKNQKIIKNCAIFFVILAGLGIFAGLLMVLIQIPA